MSLNRVSPRSEATALLRPSHSSDAAMEEPDSDDEYIAELHTDPKEWKVWKKRVFCYH
jgi:hypothetical protein